MIMIEATDYPDRASLAAAIVSPGKYATCLAAGLIKFGNAPMTFEALQVFKIFDRSLDPAAVNVYSEKSSGVMLRNSEQSAAGDVKLKPYGARYRSDASN